MPNYTYTDADLAEARRLAERLGVTLTRGKWEWSVIVDSHYCADIPLPHKRCNEDDAWQQVARWLLTGDGMLWAIERTREVANLPDERLVITERSSCSEVTFYFNKPFRAQTTPIAVIHACLALLEVSDEAHA